MHAPRSRTISHSHPRRPDPGHALVSDPDGIEPHVPDDLAETLADVYLRSATSGEEQAEEVLNGFVPEEAGGPFLEEAVAPDLDSLEASAGPGRFLAFGRRRG